MGHDVEPLIVGLNGGIQSAMGKYKSSRMIIWPDSNLVYDMNEYRSGVQFQTNNMVS